MGRQIEYTTNTMEAALDRIEGMLAEGWVLVRFHRTTAGHGYRSLRIEMLFKPRGEA